MKCPYCCKIFKIPDKVEPSIEAYGTRFIYIRCNHCTKVISVLGRVSVTFSNPTKTSRESDW